MRSLHTKTTTRRVLCLSTTLTLFVAITSSAADIKHCFLAKDESRAELHYVDQFEPANGWTLKLIKGCRDIQLLDHNRVLVSFADGFAEFDMATQKKVLEIRKPEFKKTESIIRLPNGNTVLGANQKGVTFFKMTAKGEILRKVNFPQYNTIRLMRLSSEGHFLFGANTDHVIVANWNGKVLEDFQVPDAKHIYWVKQLNSSTYRVSTGYGKSIIDVTAEGKILRTLGGTDEYYFFAHPFELPNGNIVVCNWTGHKPTDSKKAAQLVEFDPNGNVVWKWHDPQRAGTIHGVIILK